MEKSMKDLTITTSGNEIMLSQEDIGGNSESVVIAPAQVPVVCEWLKEAALEIESQQKKS